MKTIILYTSKTGATEKYAKWMQEKIGNCEIQNIELQPEIDFEQYQRVIFALPTYSGLINKKEVLERNWDKIKSKDVYLVVVGGVPQDSPWSQKSFNSINEDVRNNLKGYVKIIGLAMNPDKEIGRVERFLTKVFLKTDPDKLENRKEVFEDDLIPVWEILGITHKIDTPMITNNDVIDAHKVSAHNRESLLKSKTCGCFYCLKEFSPAEILEWWDVDENQIGQTAVCPYCGIDSVIGSFDVEFDFQFLEEMNKHWF